MKHWVSTRQSEPVAYRLLWTSRGEELPGVFSQFEKFPDSWVGLGGWAGFRWAQHISRSAEMSFVLWEIVVSGLPLLNSSPKLTVHLTVIHPTIASSKHTWSVISSTTLCFGHYPWISQGWTNSSLILKCTYITKTQLYGIFLSLLCQFNAVVILLQRKGCWVAICHPSICTEIVHVCCKKISDVKGLSFFLNTTSSEGGKKGKMSWNLDSRNLELIRSYFAHSFRDQLFRVYSL